MQFFLNDVAKKITESDKKLDQIKVIVPSIRAIKFLKEAIKNELKHPTIAPEIVSIESFITNLSGIQKASNIDLLFTFFKIYQELTPEKEQNSFSQFFNWAPSLLQEFNEIDVQLVPTEEIFSFMSAVERIEQWDPKKQGDLSKQFFKFQERVPKYYSELYLQLQNQQKGYSGLQYREATQNLGHYLQSKLPYHYFVGFNALTKAEETIIQELIAEEKAEVIWDLDQYFYQDPHHSAAYFIRKYTKQWAFLNQNPSSELSNHFSESKQIEIINVSKNLSQARAAVQKAIEIYKAHPEDKIVLVLGDEGILHPVLTAISSENVPWNASMGYPLKDLGTVTSFLKIFELFKAFENGQFSLSTVIELSENKALEGLLKDSGLPLKKMLQLQQSKRTAKISSETIMGKSIEGDLIFNSFETPITFVERMIRLSELIKKHQKKYSFSKLDIYCTDQLLKLWEQVLEFTIANPEIKALDELELIFLKLLEKETVDFAGDPFSGIQIMGVLETRVLDFDHVIITHVNEGILPFGKTPFSWIPFDVRKKFGLNTFVEQDHLYAYHFFRLLQRAKKISLFYNDASEGLFSGEKSRFLIQLEYFKLPNHEIKFKQLDFQLQAQSLTPKQAVKSAAVMDRLVAVGTQGFSPSSLLQYLRDPYQFYEQRLLGIRPEDEFESDINAADKGTIIHKILEFLYEPFLDKVMEPKHYDEMLKILPDKLNLIFKEKYPHEALYTGKNYLILEVTCRILKQFIEREKSFVENGNELTIKGLEKKFHLPVFVPVINKEVYLKGTVDRIDNLNGISRIVDYKTGNVNAADLSFVNWEELVTNPKKGPLFQVMLYAYALKDKTPVNSGIIPLKNFDNQFLSVRNQEKGGKGALSIDSEVLKMFEKQLFKLFAEIYDPKIPFEQTTDKS
ncbi:MAG: PD-(D/E)XK nuclease family protein [Flavobacteriaceae bacterium]|nr:PD-(D/E)XK nuclease family protein [Flavobacteriaceae bacterium]MDG2387373.1 PD-(D/E)XK nuclease family protein [Flavobacteriaceae bacterium]